MSDKKKIVHKGMNKRFWLNKAGYHSIGLFHGSLEDMTEGDIWCGGGSITIGDCSRTINLSIEVNGKGNRTNSLYKLDRLIAGLQEYRERFLEQCEIMEEAERKKKKDSI